MERRRSYTSLTDVALVEEHVRLRALRRAGGPPIRLVRAGEGAAEVVAWADREEIRAVLAALLENACAASPDAGEVAVTVAISGSGDAVQFEVSDQGQGISAEMLSGAADFGHGPEGSNDRPGLGIGLWVARELAARNGGSLAVAGRVGEGTRVTVKLPSAEVSARVGAARGATES